jgi:serine/threonine-protein kinase
MQFEHVSGWSRARKLLETGLGLFKNEDRDAADPTPVLRERHSVRAPTMLADFGDYELLEEIGRGGQGVVYRAHQKSLNRTVALKMIGLGPWATEAHLKRFRREAEAAASLNHPFIVPIHEVGERDGFCYFSMDFVEGGQLDEVVKQEPMAIRQAAELIVKVARTVHYAHEHGILHRDIKPGNILLDKNGEPHLTDFGLARIVETESTVTHTLEVLGTPSYMAPEQAAGEHAKLSKATDVYGLGAVLYQLLTGHPPFAGGTTYETIKLVLETEPRRPRLLNPKIDRDLSTICLKCLEKDPQRRYSTALALADDLEHWLKHEPIQARPSGIFTRGRKWVRRKPSTAALITLLIVIAAGLGAIIWNRESAGPVPEKSIAVLPFRNLSKEKEDAYFADGVQDEILTELARIAELKVISRTSTMQYKSGALRNLRNIGQQLGVAHVLEGSVQRAGNRVRVNVQLINAENDEHMWAEDYDRELTDVFAIQTDLAQKIARELHAKLSPNEKARLDHPSTQNSDAYLLYIHAQDYVNRPGDFHDDCLKAEELFERAIKLDPNFAAAFAGLSKVESWMYHTYEATPAHREKARLNADESLRLQPDLPEGHLALGFSYYYCDRDYERALAEFEIAQRGLPNEAQAYLAIGSIQRRQGRWTESTANLEKAAALDPKNVSILVNLAFSYIYLRNFERADKTLDRAVALAPQSVATLGPKAYLAIVSKGDLTKAQKQISSIPADVDPDGMVTGTRSWVLTLQRRFAEALAVVQKFPGETLSNNTGLVPKAFLEGTIHLLQGDKQSSQKEFEQARVVSEQLLREAPEDPTTHAQHGLILAVLGRKQEAIAEGKRAVELLPESQDAVDGPQCTAALAQIYAWTGESNEAFGLIEHLLKVPNGLTVPGLKLDPVWDPLRGDPAFQKLCEEKQP